MSKKRICSDSEGGGMEATLSSSSSSYHLSNQSKLNPLDIPEILEVIFKDITNVNDLKCIRSVKKCWSEAALVNWRNCATVQVTLAVINQFYEEEQGIYINNGLFEQCSREYIKFYLREHPFSRYRVPYYHMSLPPSAGRLQEIFFWRELGKSMKYLDLDLCIFKWAGVVEGLKWLLVNCCPNLEELRMAPYKRKVIKIPRVRPRKRAVAETERTERRKDYPPRPMHSDDEDYIEIEEPEVNLSPPGAKKLETFILSAAQSETEDFVEVFSKLELCREFLKLVPGLKNLTLKTRDSAFQMLEALQTERAASGDLIKLRALDINAGRQDILAELHNYILRARPPLKILKIRESWSRSWSGEPILDLERTLEGIGDYLEEFMFTIDCDDLVLRNSAFILSRSVIQLAFLRSFTLIINYNRYEFDMICFEVVLALGNMPGLKEFRFECKGPPRFERIMSRKMICMKDLQGFSSPEGEGYSVRMMELESFSFCGWLGDEILENFGKVTMPRVKRIETILDNRSLPLILEKFKMLREVKLLKISSVSEEVIEEIKALYPSVTIIN